MRAVVVLGRRNWTETVFVSPDAAPKTSHTDKYWAVNVQGQRYDTGIPYGLMETQLALALNGVHRTEMCEAIARILAMQVKS